MYYYVGWSLGVAGDNLNETRYEVSKHFRNKKREYLKDKIN
jgi:hypothetical protein